MVWKGILGFLEEDKTDNFGTGDNSDDEIKQSFDKYLPISLSGIIYIHIYIVEYIYMHIYSPKHHRSNMKMKV